MEQWRTLPEGSSKKVGKFDPAKVQALADDLELERLPDVKETILDIDSIMKNSREISLIRPSQGVAGIRAGIDVLGRYFIRIPEDVDRYRSLRSMLVIGTRLIDDFLPRPRNDRQIVSTQILWSKIDKHQNVATHWMVDTSSPGEDHIVRGR